METVNYCSKRYEMKFFKIFKLSIFAEDRENGIYKIFVWFSLFNKELGNVTFNVGSCEDKNIYAYRINRGEKSSLEMEKKNTKIGEPDDYGLILFSCKNKNEKIEVKVSKDLKDKFIENNLY